MDSIGDWTVDTGDQGQGEWLTLDEAAHYAGRSVKTLRRWIKSGKLAAELVDTEHGQAYRVGVQALEDAQRVVDVARVQRPPDTATLSAAIAQALEQRDAQWLQAITDLREEVRQLRDHLQLTQLEATKPHAEFPAPVPTSRRPWWQFWKPV